MNAYAPFKLAQRYRADVCWNVSIHLANGVIGALYGVIDMANVEATKDFASIYGS